MESQGPNSLVGQNDRVLKMKKETKGGERGSVFIRFMLSCSCWGVGEFPRTLGLLSWEESFLTQTANELTSHTQSASVPAPSTSNVK